MPRFLGTLGKIALAGGSVIVIASVGLLVALNVSPRPFAWIVERQFAAGVGVEPVIPPLYHDLSPEVRIERDIEYPSQFGSNRLDVFSPTMPTAFITDGNAGSFEADARKLEAGLIAEGVVMESLYYAPGHGTIGHEYQFDFSIPESMECLEKTLEFLGRVAATDSVRG
jgi:hypothetical protein